VLDRLRLPEIVEVHRPVLAANIGADLLVDLAQGLALVLIAGRSLVAGCLLLELACGWIAAQDAVETITTVSIRDARGLLTSAVFAVPEGWTVFGDPISSAEIAHLHGCFVETPGDLERIADGLDALAIEASKLELALLLAAGFAVIFAHQKGPRASTNLLTRGATIAIFPGVHNLVFHSAVVVLDDVFRGRIRDDFGKIRRRSRRV